MKNRWHIFFCLLFAPLTLHASAEAPEEPGTLSWPTISGLIDSGVQVAQRLGNQLSFLMRRREALQKADPLLWAIEQDDCEVVSYLINEQKRSSEDSLATIVNEQFLTRKAYPILEAARYGHLSIVKLLIENGARFVHDRKTALHCAASGGHLGVIKHLIEQGAKIDAEDDLGATPLHVAAFSGELKAVKYLWTVYKGRLRDAQKFLDGTHRTSTGCDTDTVLVGAVRAGDIEIVKYLAGEGAALSTPFSSSLCIACLHHRLDVVLFLLANGADINEVWYDRTPLHAAFIKPARDYQRFHDLVKILLTQHANVNARVSSGFTVLHRACMRPYPSELIRSLLDNGADVNARDANSRAPIHEAAAYGCLKTLKLLLEKGADMTVCDSKGNNLLHEAAYNGQISVVKFLLKKMARGYVRVRNREGRTPLLVAAAHYWTEVVNCLMEYYREHDMRMTPEELAPVLNRVSMS